VGLEYTWLATRIRCVRCRNFDKAVKFRGKIVKVVPYKIKIF
jgi:hypothetical protein